MKQAAAGPPSAPVLKIRVGGFDPDVFPCPDQQHAPRTDAHTPPVLFDSAHHVVLSLLFSPSPVIMATSPLSTTALLS